MGSGPVETVEELREVLKEEVLEFLKDEVREARGFLKDLKKATKEAEDTIGKTLHDKVEQLIAAEVQKELAKMSGEIEEAMNAATEKVGKEFDKLANLLLGVDAKNRRKGNPSIEEVVKNAVTVALEKEVLDRANQDPRFRKWLGEEMLVALNEAVKGRK